MLTRDIRLWAQVPVQLVVLFIQLQRLARVQLVLHDPLPNCHATGLQQLLVLHHHEQSSHFLLTHVGVLQELDHGQPVGQPARLNAPPYTSPASLLLNDTLNDSDQDQGVDTHIGRQGGHQGEYCCYQHSHAIQLPSSPWYLSGNIAGEEGPQQPTLLPLPVK